LALDYKVRIEAKNPIKAYKNLIDAFLEKITDRDGKEIEKMRYKNLPTFFGNMMKPEEYKSGEKKPKKITFFEDIEIKFICFIPQLKNEIKTHFPEFLFKTNFGTRQSKGFGSFYLNDEYPNFDFYHFNINDISKDGFYDLFKAIDLFYRTLKSGLNIKAKKNGNLVDKIYFKSLMFHYAKNLNPPEQWDKRTIRHTLFLTNWKYKNDKKQLGIFYYRQDPNGTVHFFTTKPSNRNYYDFRDLLGLSTEQEWKYYNSLVKKEVTKTINDNTFTIDRFPSPILFKPIYNLEEKRWIVYIILNQNIPPEYESANVHVYNNRKSVDLTIYPEFDLNEFFKYAINKFSINDFEYGNGYNKNNTEEVKILENIYSQLKKQVQ